MPVPEKAQQQALRLVESWDREQDDLTPSERLDDVVARLSERYLGKKVPPLTSIQGGRNDAR